MAYKSLSEYFDDIRRFVVELENDDKTEASKRLKECFECIDGVKDEWKMFYKKLLFMKEEFSYKFTKAENTRLDQIIEAAKRVVYRI